MPPKRNRPSGGTRAASKSTATDYAQSSGDNRHQAPTAEERHEQALLAELKALGYTISVRCLACGHPLTHPKSVARFIGPRCHAKAVSSDV